MTDERRQRLSALVDGEGSDSELRATIAETLLDPELAQTWERYHAIGRVLRGEVVGTSARGVAAGVSARLASEPPPAANPGPSAPVDIARGRRAAAAGPIVGLAVAAGLAMVAVVVAPRLGPSEPGPAVAQSVSPPPPAMAQPATLDRWTVSEPGVSGRLNEMLVSHRERSSASGLGGLMPYVAVVGYAGRR